MQDNLENNGNHRYSIITGINKTAAIFKKYQQDIPVYEDIQLSKLADEQPSYTLKGDVHRRGDLFISLKDDCMLPLWDKGDLVLLKQVKNEALVMGDRYYLVLKDGKEWVGVLTDTVDAFVITPENVIYKQVQCKKEDVWNMYKVMEGLKKTDLFK
ncbi:hypothetical protein [Chitinophaga sp.]|uniref:hypothetical protein n=1 Tax=Chitinophaga sp. TaxID=1869181 RepID=UPI0031DC0853